MLFFAFLLSTSGFLIALANFADKFYNAPERDAAWREVLISLIGHIEHRTPRIAGNEIPGLFLLSSLAWLWAGLAFAMVYFHLFLFRFIGAHTQGLLATFNRWSFYLELPKLVLFSVLLIVVFTCATIGFLVSSYGIVRVFVLIVSREASDPRRNPITYLAATAAIAVAFGAMIVAASKAFFS